MANITPASPTIAGATAAFAAIAVSGDEVVYSGGDLLIEFDNGHASSITVNFAPTQTTGIIPGAGVATVPTRSLAIAAGAKAAFRFKKSEITAYLNASKRLPITYTSGNTAMLIRAFSLK